MRTVDALVCLRPGELRVEAATYPAPRGWRGAGAAAPGRHLRHRLPHLRGQAPVPRIPARDGPRARRRAARAGRGPRAPGEVCVVNPYVSCGDCVACRARQAQLLRAHRRPRRPPRRRHDRAPRRAGRQPGAGAGPDADECATVEFLAIGAHAVRRGGRLGARSRARGRRRADRPRGRALRPPRRSGRGRPRPRRRNGRRPLAQITGAEAGAAGRRSACLRAARRRRLRRRSSTPPATRGRWRRASTTSRTAAAACWSAW